MEQMGIDCVIGISTLFIPFFCLCPVDSPNELSSMIDFHISGMPTFTKHRLLEKLCHARGMEWAVKYGTGNSLV